MTGCDDEGEGAERLEVEGIGESKEGEATAVAIAKVERGVMTWRGTNDTTRKRKGNGKRRRVRIIKNVEVRWQTQH